MLFGNLKFKIDLFKNYIILILIVKTLQISWEKRKGTICEDMKGSSYESRTIDFLLILETFNFMAFY